MGKGHKSLGQHKAVKRTVKFLAHAPDPSTVQEVLMRAPDFVIRAIANAALNAQEGDVRLTPPQKRLFRAYAHTFDVLCDRQLSIADKRRHLLSRSRLALQCGPLLASMLGSVGSTFISRVKGGHSSAE